MTIRHILVTSIAGLALAAAPAIHATPTSVTVPMHAAFGKVKTVHISFRNDSISPLELKVGDNLMTLDPGKTLDLRLPVGTRVVSNTSTANFAAGSLIIEVASYLSDTTLGIK